MSNKVLSSSNLATPYKFKLKKRTNFFDPEFNKNICDFSRSHALRAEKN